MADETAPVELDKAGLRKHYLTLTESQRPFVRVLVDWYRKPRKLLAVVSGGPGTGKSHVVKSTLAYVRGDCLFMSLTAKSAQALGGETIHSTVSLDFRNVCADELKEETDLGRCIRETRDLLNEFTYEGNPHVVVVDEVSMIDIWLIYWLVHFFMERTVRPLLFVCMGDPHQLKPFKSVHNLFSLDLERLKWETAHLVLKESCRFTPDYGRLVDRLRDLVDEGDETGVFAFLCHHFPVVESIEGELLVRAERAMAAKNDRVNTFNAYYLKRMMPGPRVRIEDGLVLKPGCLVMVTANGCSTAKNGTELVFEAFEDRKHVVCRDPKTGEKVKVRRGAHGKFHLALGFAATVHKFQGGTVDCKIVVHLDGSRNLNLVYTALSRVRDMDQILGIAL